MSKIDQIILITGPRGSGKTNSMLTLSKLLWPIHGHVQIFNGQLPENTSALKGRIVIITTNDEPPAWLLSLPNLIHFESKKCNVS